MTTDEFITELARTTSILEWQWFGFPNTPLHELKMIKGFDEQGRTHCPLTAVYQLLNPKTEYNNAGMAVGVASRMGIGEKDAMKIIRAADGVEATSELRARLVAAVGLGVVEEEF